LAARIRGALTMVAVPGVPADADAAATTTRDEHDTTADAAHKISRFTKRPPRPVSRRVGPGRRPAAHGNYPR